MILARLAAVALGLLLASAAGAQTTKKISELTAGTPPYAAGTLFEISVPSGGGYVSRSTRLDQLSFTLGSTDIALSETVGLVADLTIGAGSTWNGDVVAVLYGGTGQSSYTNGQLLIGNTTGNTLVKGTLTQPAAGITISNGAGTITFALADDLAALEGLGTTGLAARTGASTWATRSLVQPAAGITIADAGGVGGNPTFALANDLAALEAMSGTGLVARTASETYAQRSIVQPAAGITVANGDGVAGNPTLALANDLAALEGLGSTGIAVRTAADTWAQRSVAGTADRITLTNGDGVAGNPTVDIAATYVGQTSITTLGTVTTGTWDATTIAVNRGGTGQTSYTDGQLLIGNTTGNTLAKGTLTQPAAGITISNGGGTITFALANDLAGVEGLATTGLATRTAADTWTTRTITGTASRLAVTNGDGVAGNPTLDIDAAYVGQATITTLGTVTTGTWNASVILGQYGGTGVANTGKTITLGGSLTTAGAFDTTLTVTGATNSTLPAGTHTLAGLDVAQTWSANQQFNSGNFLLKGATSGTLTVQPAAVAGTNTLTLPAGTTDFSATGGAGQVVKQTSAGGAFTVATVNASELAGLGAGVATWLATPSSANLATAVTGETGSGALVFATSPSLITPNIGAATGTSLTLSTTAVIFGAVTPLLQLNHFSGIATSRFSNDTFQSNLSFGKSRGSLATAGAVVSGDFISQISSYGDDGSTNGAITILAASERVEVDGSVSTGIVPGRFVWSTRNTAGVLAERMRLTSAGNVGIGTTTPQALLHVGTTAGTARVYNSFTDASNGEWAYMGDWGHTANVATYGSDENGTGTDRDMQLVTGGVAGLRMHATTQLIAIGPSAALTSSFPAAKRSATVWQHRLADDSAFGPMAASEMRQYGGETGQFLNVKSLTELTTIAAAASTTTTIQIPANAKVIAVSVRVTTAIPTAATFDVGVAGATTRFGTGLSTAANTTNPGTNDDGARYYAASTGIVITPNLTPADTTGRVRVTIHYIEVTPPTS